MDKKHVLVTGGAGYIGSHTVLELLQTGYEVVVLDTLSNSSIESLKNVCKLTQSRVYFYQGDLADAEILDAIFRNHPIWAVIHFAALKSAPESVARPLDYYRVNVDGSVSLLEAMTRHHVHRLVFSSTAAVYGKPDPNTTLIDESHPTRPENPYGRSKRMVETIIEDTTRAVRPLGSVVLRYFNPVGAHESGLIGEDPKGRPGNLMPLLLQVMTQSRKHLEITGTDWPTPDGSGMRDFIHVVDLAKGHVKALEHADRLCMANGGFDTLNMGTGAGTTVLQMIRCMESLTNSTIPYVKGPRRVGDVAAVVADPHRAQKILKWKATRGLEMMCADAWRFRQMNPEGYVSTINMPSADSLTSPRASIPGNYVFVSESLTPTEGSPLVRRAVSLKANRPPNEPVKTTNRIILSGMSGEPPFLLQDRDQFSHPRGVPIALTPVSTSLQ
ncbi:uncharacterized protein EV422DRAFT_578276 [Fimicolochytrium jonesii]|uniref:uncharacterized protein n=1 Tax=Fimicolochytrium jonesii TaxID=1396493 RepID=UPI0022FE7A31|nr:uncharacterized protein EV422DRAFT_578276 [Fimicolochytrium jonesii]KAI8821453.1 hypothetical protein EV422DRAFT_578276 [Fimicolochytrium jonesii]